MTGFPYVWTWSQRTWQLPGVTCKAPWFGDGVDRAGQYCRVIARGGMNSALVEFADGYRVVTSRGGMRRAGESGGRKALLVPGHTLAARGLAVVPGEEPREGPGRGICSCGEPSPELPSTPQRRDWHWRHKVAVAAAMKAEEQ